MSEFVITPTNVDFLESIFRNPITNKWTIPILTFNTVYSNPFYRDVDPLNNDPRYHESVINYFYTKLTEKWLYRDAAFRQLLKFFKITTEGTKGEVSMIDIKDLDKNSYKNISEEELGLRNQYKKYIFQYIEKYFITKHLVGKILKQYIRRTHTKWYDLFNNTDIIKDLMSYKLKKLIIATIYELADQKNSTQSRVVS